MIVLAMNYWQGPAIAGNPAEYPSGRIARYAWNDDYHDLITPKLAELDQFLQQRGATFPNFLLNKDDKDGTQKWLDAYDIGPIPVVLVFGRDGKLAKKFDREDPDHPFTYADVNKLVEELNKKL